MNLLEPPTQALINNKNLIASDGNGYALTTMAIILFVLQPKPVINDLGVLSDDAGTNSSVHSRS
jgi:hypothetical protein